jgi:DNA (cytosine-5)-methyltransferase 1
VKILDLFSGIGGFSLGLERAGMTTIAFCEIDPYCRRVLRKHWPDVPIYDDVRTLTAERLVRDGIAPDVICGGFPCQDVSLAGARKGLDGERSGLWFEYARIIGEVRPHYVIVENTPGLLSLGMDVVLGDLAALGYDAEWHCIPASAVGADHGRDRVWIIAYSDLAGIRPNDQRWRKSCTSEMGSPTSDVGPHQQLQSQGSQQDQRRWTGNGLASNDADADRARCPRGLQAGTVERVAQYYGARIRLAVESAADFPREHWDHQPVLGRGLHGIPDRLDRIGALGNAVVPQIPELIGRAIMEAAA